MLTYDSNTTVVFGKITFVCTQTNKIVFYSEQRLESSEKMEITVFVSLDKQ